MYGATARRSSRASTDSAPRTETDTTAGSTDAWRPDARLRTATPTPAYRRSPVASMVTVTRAVFASRSRSVASGTPTLTVAATVLFAPSIDTRSVVAVVVLAMRRAGPTMTTVGGSAVIWLTTNPDAGVPSTSGLTGTLASPACSST